MRSGMFDFRRRKRARGAMARRGAFSLVELLVAIAVIALLVGLLLPTLGGARSAAQDVVCVSNQRQMFTALHLYLTENRRTFFPLVEKVSGAGDYWWFGFEQAGGPTTEGDRVLERSKARLWSYYEIGDSIEICPAYALDSPHYKPKFSTNWTTYAIPLQFMGNSPAGFGMDHLRLSELTESSRTVAFADAVNFNAFQPPATPMNPMFEQWYYLTPTGRFVHYVHGLEANAVMFDGHVRRLAAGPDLQTRFPEAPMGSPPDDVKVTR